MMRKSCKYIFAVVIMLHSLNCMPAYAAPMAADPVGEVNPSGRGALDYETAYGPIFDELDTENEYGWYTLWDINGSGTAEVIIGHGESPDDYVNDVWVVDDDGRAIYTGSFSSECDLYQDPAGNAVIAVDNNQNDKIFRITVNNAGLIIEDINESSCNPDEQTYSSESMLAGADIRNRGSLELWSFLKVLRSCNVSLRAEEDKGDDPETEKSPF